MEQKTQFRVKWIDRGLEPQCASNHAYPKGIDLNVANGAVNSCVCQLPYPAKRIGAYVVDCLACGFRGACTAAGRPDDPRSIEMPCKRAAAEEFDWTALAKRRKIERGLY